MDTKSFDITCSRDAINRLPDEILAKILSLLSTKQAASTSVLSKKWRYVFNLVENLDFDDSVLGHNKQVRYGFPESFKNFVDQTLALQCNFPVKKFSLKTCIRTDNECHKACMDRWISNVLERGVLELELRLKAPSKQRLPPQLFASKTLVKLSLGLDHGHVPSYVSLPSLKSLFIDKIFFTQKDFCSVLLAGCPVLEELSSSATIIKDSSYRADDQTISSMSVKRLSVLYNSFRHSSNLSLDLPNLVYLNYSDFALCEYPQVNLKSLVVAKLDLCLAMLSESGSRYNESHYGDKKC